MRQIIYAMICALLSRPKFSAHIHSIRLRHTYVTMMAHYCNTTITVLLKLGILILACLSTPTDGLNSLSLEDRLQQLAENYIKIKDDLAAKDARLETLIENFGKITDLLVAKDARLEELESTVSRLEEKDRQQELAIKTLQKDKCFSSEIREAAIGKGVSIGRTCRELRAADPSLTSGMHWIDPDGQGVGDEPILVYCDMVRGSTAVLHDSESAIDVGHCADPGCYSRPVRYNATMNQIKALADLSIECHQSIKYDCNFSPLQINDIAYAWWNDVNGTAQYFWSGSNSSVHTCQCGIDNNCVETSMTCNCDSGAPVPLSDNGVITDKSFLPVTRLSFGRTQLASSSGIHTLGRFECTGQVTFVGRPKSCSDLLWIGHTLNGLYSVMGTNQVEMVYCDFTKLPADPDFEMKIGQIDVKSNPVYFYVQKNTYFNRTNVAIPFQVERLNVGGAMNIATGIFTAPRPGVYFFSFAGIGSPTYASYPELYVNNNAIGRGKSHTNYYTNTIQSTLRLTTGDQVSLKLNSGGTGYLYDDTYHYTHFTGWILQEEL